MEIPWIKTYFWWKISFTYYFFAHFHINDDTDKCKLVTQQLIGIFFNNDVIIYKNPPSEKLYKRQVILVFVFDQRKHILFIFMFFLFIFVCSFFILFWNILQIIILPVIIQLLHITFVFSKKKNLLCL